MATGWSGWSGTQPDGRCLPLLIFPCTIKFRSSLLAPADLGGPGKRAIKWLWCGTDVQLLQCDLLKLLVLNLCLWLVERRKLTEEEMAAKRAEMMENARGRDEERTRNVKRYREDDERDRLRAEKSAVAAGFVQ